MINRFINVDPTQGRLDEAAACFELAANAATGKERGSWLTNLAKSLESSNRIEESLGPWLESFQLVLLLVVLSCSLSHFWFQFDSPDLNDLARIASHLRNFHRMEDVTRFILLILLVLNRPSMSTKSVTGNSRTFQKSILISH